MLCWLRRVVPRAMSRRKFPVLLLALGVAACGTITEKSYLYVAKRPDTGVEVLTVGCLVGQTADECQSMTPVTITNDPKDEEFWMFEARVLMRAAIGIPYGRMPQDVPVLGPRTRCEAVRATVRADTPTEPCKGPMYFKRGQK